MGQAQRRPCPNHSFNPRILQTLAKSWGPGPLLSRDTDSPFQEPQLVGLSTQPLTNKPIFSATRCIIKSLQVQLLVGRKFRFHNIEQLLPLQRLVTTFMARILCLTVQRPPGRPHTVTKDGEALVYIDWIPPEFQIKRSSLHLKIMQNMVGSTLGKICDDGWIRKSTYSSRSQEHPFGEFETESD